MSQEPSTIRVEGRAVVSAEPDEVVMAIELSALRPTPDDALSDVARRSELLESIFGRLELDRKTRTTSGASVREEREWQEGRHHHRGYTASVTITVRLEDERVVGRLMRLATTEAQARISGPWWRVALDNPARAEACRRAAADALRKAGAYSEALGARLGAVVSATEPAVRRPYDDDGVPVRVAMVASGPEPPEVEVHAGALDVAAAVEVTFRLEQH